MKEKAKKILNKTLSGGLKCWSLLLSKKGESKSIVLKLMFIWDKQERMYDSMAYRGAYDLTNFLGLNFTSWNLEKTWIKVK